MIRVLIGGLSHAGLEKYITGCQVRNCAVAYTMEYIPVRCTMVSNEPLWEKQDDVK